MPKNQHRLPLVDLRATDAEIAHFAALLDGLDIALAVFAGDGTLRMRNARADALFGDESTLWLDADGRPLAEAERPHFEVLRTGHAVQQRAIGIGTPTSGVCAWCTASALPVLSESGRLRRVLLVLADIKPHLAGADEHLPTMDPLTGVCNQRHILSLLDDECRRARRYGAPLAVALIAIDRFAECCAAEGEESGEQALATVGHLLGRSLREFDAAGRFGADGFLLVLPNVGGSDALIGLERLREKVEAGLPGDGKIRLTVSGGVSEYNGEDAAAVVERVRCLLASAREAGCNRICLDLDVF